jgi:Na+:H+ antiporter, NhaA family
VPQATRARPPVRSRVADQAEDLAEFLRQETVGGKLLLAATAFALVWANVAADSYHSFWTTQTSLGPGWLHLDLTLGDWAADGLLAIFFFIAGMELKRELTVGELADRRAATLPVFAAVGGMIMPALVVLAVSRGAASEGGAWAIPVATDIAFALGVLALAGAALPSGVRVILLSVAVVDDLLAITLIAILFTSGLSLLWLAGGLAVGGLYWLALRLGADRAWLLWILALATWICIHASGVHATVAGILLGLLTPVRPRRDEEHSASERLEHRLHPISAGFAVPVFALAATGITVAAAGNAINDQIAIGVFLGLLVGKVAGIYGGARLAVRLGLGTLPEEVRWADVLPVAVLGAIGYTVSLLIARLAFDDAAAVERSAAAVLTASVIASLLALVLLRRQARPA